MAIPMSPMPDAFVTLAARAEKEPGFRQEAIETLARIYRAYPETAIDTDRAAVKIVAPYLGDADGSVRKAATAVFDDIGDKLYDKNPAIAVSLLSALFSYKARVKAPEIQEALQGAIDGIEKPWRRLIAKGAGLRA